ncbi:MAG: efflux RND transporter periplasmic adaptor subunit [Planctomycetota bacterium]
MPCPRPSSLLPVRWLLPVALLAVGFLAGCTQSNAGEGDKKEEVKVPLVRAVKAELRNVRREIRTTGFLESEQMSTIVSLVSGRLSAIYVDEGTLVTSGQLLAAVDDREAKAGIQQLTVLRDGKELDQQLAALEVEAADRRIAQASIEVQKARAEFDRQSQTRAEFVSPKALQDAELAWQSLNEAVEVAKFNASKARLEVKRIATTIDELKARIDELQVRLEHHRITAPFAGVITSRQVSVGANVGASTTLFEMVDPDHLVAWLDRPQAELDLVRNGKIATFTTDALPGRDFTADVDQVSPVVDRLTGHFRMRIRVREADARTLLHGMFIRARIQAEDLREALMIPKAAMLSEGETAVVMVARSGKAIRTDLDPGLELDDWIETKNRGANGLQPGELVIVEGHEDLEDQAAVRLQQ